MQNCLQSKKARFVPWPLCLILVVAVAALAVAVAYNAKSGVLSHKSTQTPKYLLNVSKVSAEAPAFALKNTAKMNNELPKNAKMYSLTADNSEKKLTLPKKVKLLCSDGSKRELELEEYVTGCVLGEMPLDFESQALMAQCVAVRSFTARQLLLGSKKHKDVHVCANPACCQNYINPDSLKIGEENRKKLSDAVNATRGVILTYLGEPIEAVYHAASGSCTLDSEKVWGGRVEYLRSVKAPDGEEDIAAFGMGHRVGLSQHGANLLAKEGKNYMQILSYYYTGVSFSFI